MVISFSEKEVNEVGPSVIEAAEFITTDLK